MISTACKLPTIPTIGPITPLSAQRDTAIAGGGLGNIQRKHGQSCKSHL